MATDDRVDDLYALPLGEFTAARNALAKDLKNAGDKEAADAVKKQPTRVRWPKSSKTRPHPRGGMQV